MENRVNNIEKFPPQHLLLASDLCARCDRPLDRAKQLASEWRASVRVLMVREGPGTPEEVSSWLNHASTVHPFELAARADLAEEFAGTGIDATLQVVRGDVTDSIIGVAAVLTDVVIVGASRADAFQQLFLGSTAARLVQELAQPLLVVRLRTRGCYARIVVATDFSDAARRALVTTVRLFPGRRISLLHVLDASALPASSALAIQAAQEDSECFLDRCALPATVRERIDIVIGHGTVPDALTRHVQASGTQLAVLGVHPHSALSRVLVGNISDELLRRLPCDTLLVRACEGDADE